MKKSKFQNRKSKIAVAFVLGLVVALIWHFGHAASENYTAAFSDPHFWFHLLLEGGLALYTFVICSVIWTVLERMRQTRNSSNTDEHR